MPRPSPRRGVPLRPRVLSRGSLAAPAAAYDAVKLLAAAARANGPTREGIQRCLNTLGEGGAPAFQGATGDIRFDGVAGPVAFDVNGDPQGKTCAIGTVRGGRLVLGA